MIYFRPLYVFLNQQTNAEGRELTLVVRHSISSRDVMINYQFNTTDLIPKNINLLNGMRKVIKLSHGIFI